MTNSMVRSNDDKNDKNNAFSPRGPMDENHNPKNYENSACPLRDSHYKLKLLQQQLLQQQDVVVEVSASSSSSSSPLREENRHSLECSNDDDVSSSSITAMASYSSPLMVLAAAAAATETMDPSSSSLLLCAIPTTTTMNTFESSTNNTSDPINNNNYYYSSSNKCTIAISPFCCTTNFENERSASMSMTSASSPYFPYLRHGNTYSPLNSTAPAARLDCLAAVSSHARDAATAPATDTPCRRRRRRSTESMLLDEQKCLLAMSAVPPYAHPLFSSSTTGNQHSKMPFTTEEKGLLMTVVAQHGNGPKNWIDIAKVYFPGKSVLQVKNCWHNAHKRKKNQGRAPSSRSITPVPPPKPVSRQHIPAPFLVPESATTTTPSTVTRSRSRAMAQDAANVPNTAMTTAPGLFQPPFSSIKSHSNSTSPPVTRVAHVVAAVSANATSSTGGRSRLLSRDIAQKSNMVVSTFRKRSHSFVRWSMREDNILKQAFEMEGPTWEEIATTYFGNTRSDEQCKNRWTKVNTSTLDFVFATHSKRNSTLTHTHTHMLYFFLLFLLCAYTASRPGDQDWRMDPRRGRHYFARQSARHELYRYC
jgi:Myb-like DNA-binding domain